MSKKGNSSRTKAYILLLITVAIWGVAGPVIKYTQRGITALPFLTYRFFISAVFGLVFITLAKQIKKAERQNLFEIIIYGFLVSTVSLGFLFLGIQNTTVLDAALISAIAPMVSAIAGVIFLKEIITKRERLGISIAFLGTLVTVAEPLIKNGLGHSQFIGNLLVVGYITTNAISSVMSKRLVRKRVRPLALVNITFIVGFLTLLPLAHYSGGLGEIINQARTLTFNYQLGVFFMALISGNLAYAMWVRAQKTIEISEAGVFAYLIPIFSAPLAIFWLGEKITTPFIIGAVLISIGVYIAERKKS